ncbi:MAG: tRNA uridine-5-carboxymethylaminomethyl(34) synthesis GTPase MnmE, partial [Bacteroidaceae bacterium]|nr:tRNA uridine-5-carboxymethylaminomethyl(34) synthesis GTPase MnmE [Bacteroidaceae bacterium]
MNNDTICAPATTPGGAIGIIRVSGPQAFSAVSALCSVCCNSVAPNTVHYTRIVVPSACDAASPHREIIDEAMVTVFRAPRSYTGEDSVEISCHGSRYILNKVLELLVQHGCRMAQPGEFTQRAFLNGKMDLSQAEAVADLIASTNRATHQMAMNQLRGGISSELSALRDKLLNLTSLLELELDFSDHEDLEFADRAALLDLARLIDKRILQLADSFQRGQALKQGIPVAIVGAPNVGKSTLLNALLGEERAIVSDIQGTTRDTIEDTLEINGATFRFIDTAGIRHTSDRIETLGIDRS